MVADLFFAKKVLKRHFISPVQQIARSGPALLFLPGCSFLSEHSLAAMLNVRVLFNVTDVPNADRASRDALVKFFMRDNRVTRAVPAFPPRTPTSFAFLQMTKVPATDMIAGISMVGIEVVEPRRSSTPPPDTYTDDRHSDD